MIERERPTTLVRMRLLGNFFVERKTNTGLWEEVEKSAWVGTYARVLLKRLACALDRRATRSELLDDLWPDKSSHLAEKYLNNAASKLRQILHQDIIQPIGARGLGGYRLREQAFVWVDLEAWNGLLKEVEQLRAAGTDTLALLEQAEQYIEGSKLLEGEGGQWCLPIRTRHETAVRHCRLSLAQEYEARNRFLQAKDQYERLLELDPLDEDTLCRLFTLLQRQGMSRDLRARYEQAKKQFPEYGFSLSQATQALAEQLLQAPPLSSLLTCSTDLSIPYQAGSLSIAPKPVAVYNTRSISSSSLPDMDMLMKSRRQALKEMLLTACATLALSPYALFPPDARERLEVAIVHPSSVDAEALTHLTAVTKHYWKLSLSASRDLLSGLAGHFTVIIQLLKESHPAPIYEKLCALASENALLLGKAFFEIREHDLALASYLFALRAAREAHSAEWWATGAGWIGLLYMYWGDPHEALPFLSEAQRQPLQNQRLPPWLSAIEAEIHAKLGHLDACLRCLERSKSVTLQTDEDLYETSFNASKAAGYEGSCFLLLRQPERALPALLQASTQCDPTWLHRRSQQLADRGTAYAQLGDVQTACSHMLEALEITERTKSLVAFQKVSQGKRELDPWKESSAVKSLDERMFEVLTTLTKLKERG
jgi:DNA-binding SARP family transcriptional activator